MAILDRCAPVTAERRRHFWTTQPNACGEFVDCGVACGLPGLLFELPADCQTCGCQCIGAEHDPACLAAYRAESTPTSFATNDWVRSLLLNIFNTVARVPASECGNLPGRQGGHWSESYGDGTYIGTHMFENKPQASFRDALSLLNAKVSKDAYKLVTYGVATDVDVETKYLGGDRVSVTITVTGQDVDAGVVNLSVARKGNSWVWET